MHTFHNRRNAVDRWQRNVVLRIIIVLIAQHQAGIAGTATSTYIVCRAPCVFFAPCVLARRAGTLEYSIILSAT